VKNKEGVD